MFGPKIEIKIEPINHWFAHLEPHLKAGGKHMSGEDILVKKDCLLDYIMITQLTNDKNSFP